MKKNHFEQNKEINKNAMKIVAFLRSYQKRMLQAADEPAKAQKKRRSWWIWISLNSQIAAEIVFFTTNYFSMLSHSR